MNISIPVLKEFAEEMYLKKCKQNYENLTGSYQDEKYDQEDNEIYYAGEIEEDSYKSDQDI